LVAGLDRHVNLGHVASLDLDLPSRVASYFQ
jgi:hypothetical protein